MNQLGRPSYSSDDRKGHQRRINLSVRNTINWILRKFADVEQKLYIYSSAINRRHDPIGVTLPRDFSRRQSVVEHLHLCGIKLDGRGGHILFQIVPALGAGDRHDEVALV